MNNRVNLTLYLFAECVPYSIEACKAVGAARGFTFKSGNWGTKGCYVYVDYRGGNSYDPKYRKQIFYGTGGTDEQNRKELSGGRARPAGFDCKPGLTIFIYNSLESYRIIAILI